MTVRRLTAVITLLGLFGAALPAFAESPTSESRRPGQIARDAADDLMRRLEELAAALPRYGLPQIAENGDIVIPRSKPPGPPPLFERPYAPLPDGREI